MTREETVELGRKVTWAGYEDMIVMHGINAEPPKSQQNEESYYQVGLKAIEYEKKAIEAGIEAEAKWQKKLSEMDEIDRAYVLASIARDQKWIGNAG